MTNETKQQTYRIVRFYQADRKPKIIDRGLTLEQAKAHCNDINTNSATCWTTSALEHTKKYGAWFDGFEKE